MRLIMMSVTAVLTLLTVPEPDVANDWSGQHAPASRTQILDEVCREGGA